MGHRHEGTSDIQLASRIAVNPSKQVASNAEIHSLASNMATAGVCINNTKQDQLLQDPAIRRVNHNHELDNVKQTAKDLAYDIVYYVSHLKKLRPSSKHAKTLRRTVDELSERHRIVFSGIVSKLELDEENGQESFENVTNEMFRDGQINWGRLATVYAWAGRLATHYAEKNLVDFVDRIAEFTGNYVSNHLCAWIHKEGGWSAFDDFFPEQANVEGTIWRGLLCTVFGLGALAAVAAAR